MSDREDGRHNIWCHLVYIRADWNPRGHRDRANLATRAVTAGTRRCDGSVWRRAVDCRIYDFGDRVEHFVRKLNGQLGNAVRRFLEVYSCVKVNDLVPEEHLNGGNQYDCRRDVVRKG